ncbi:MAG: hypothetical protein IT379_37385 [Deltaproteobacteria bacterium]|nr:hypothetical protein [Deltaproteobacteria bacterium]
MKERPILFSAPMVRAILAGAKSQTRRIVSRSNSQIGSLPQSYWDRLAFASAWADPGLGAGAYLKAPMRDPADDTVHRVRCRTKIGDRLWVREAWADADVMYGSESSEAPGVIAYYADRSAIQYNAREPRRIGPIDLSSWNWDTLRKRPSIHMPRWASRITLEVTDVRVERLQDGAVAEGVGTFAFPGTALPTAHDAFVALWGAINGKRTGASWDANPWVWVVSFRRVL